MSQSSALATLVGGMKVEAFARLAGLGVEELVAKLIDPSAPARPRASVGARAPVAGRGAASAAAPASSRRPATTRKPAAAPRSPTVSAAPLVAPDDPPPLADMLDRATYRQIHNAIDRWYVINVMNEEGGNVSRVARRLRVSRKRVRVLWARLRSGAGKDDLKKILKAPGKPTNAPPPPDIVPLLAKGTYREVHDTVDKWLLGHTLGRVEGNVSQAARDLDVSRKHLRDHLARVKIKYT